MSLCKGPTQAFLRQYRRIVDKRNIGSSKSAKQGEFSSLAEKLESVTCVETSELAETLSQCQTNIDLACNLDNFPPLNLTHLETCHSTASKFQAEAGLCLQGGSGVVEACDCWRSERISGLATQVRECSAEQQDRDTSAALKKCIAVFSTCRKTEDEVASLLVNCLETVAPTTQSPTTLGGKWLLCCVYGKYLLVICIKSQPRHVHWCRTLW